jgi:hypothetical protein
MEDYMSYKEEQKAAKKSARMGWVAEGRHELPFDRKIKHPGKAVLKAEKRARVKVLKAKQVSEES